MIQLHVSVALRRVGQVWAFDLVFVAVAGFPYQSYPAIFQEMGSVLV